MGLPIVIILLLIAAVLFIATRRGYIQSDALSDAANIAAVVAFIAAILVFVVPAATFPSSLATSTETTATQVGTSIAISSAIPTNSEISPLASSTAPLATPSPSPTLTLGEIHPFKVGDYFIYEVKARSKLIYEQREEVTGVDLVEGHQTWVIAKTLQNISTSMQETVTEEYGTWWIDQNSGVLIKSENHTSFAKPASYQWDNQDLEVIKDTMIIVYNLDQNTIDRNWTVIDSVGKEHNLQQSYAGVPGIYRITRNVQVGEWYPWKTSDNGPKVLKEETVSLASGTFDCWVIKTIEREDHQYYLYYFDKNTGMLVKDENWYNNSGTWETLEQRSLVSYKFDDK
jgi:hypothetical protein